MTDNMDTPAPSFVPLVNVLGFGLNIKEFMQLDDTNPILRRGTERLVAEINGDSEGVLSAFQSFVS